MSHINNIEEERELLAKRLANCCGYERTIAQMIDRIETVIYSTPIDVLTGTGFNKRLKEYL